MSDRFNKNQNNCKKTDNLISKIIKVSSIENKEVTDRDIKNKYSETLSNISNCEYIENPNQFARNINLPFLNNSVISDVCFIIVGLGGIGSWVAKYLSLNPNVNRIVMFDDDIVEETNLNRTLYNFDDIGNSKVECMNRKIIENRLDNDLNIFPINGQFNEENIKKILMNNQNNLMDVFLCGYICLIDCRDNLYNDYHIMKHVYENKTFEYGEDSVYSDEDIEEIMEEELFIVKPSYDGENITLDLNPKNRPVFGTEVGGYEIVPSSAIPSSLIALLTVLSVFNYYSDGGSAHLKDYMIKNPLTINVSKILESIYKGYILDIINNEIDNNIIIENFTDNNKKTICDVNEIISNFDKSNHVIVN